MVKIRIGQAPAGREIGNQDARKISMLPILLLAVQFNAISWCSPAGVLHTWLRLVSLKIPISPKRLPESVDGEQRPASRLVGDADYSPGCKRIRGARESKGSRWQCGSTQCRKYSKPTEKVNVRQRQAKTADKNLNNVAAIIRLMPPSISSRKVGHKR